MNQLAFDLAQRGAALAADHADRVHAEWIKQATEAFLAYAVKHSQFATEDVIAASPEVPDAPDKRAWGHVVLAAKKQNIIYGVGVTKSKLVHAHGRWINLWHSNVFLYGRNSMSDQIIAAMAKFFEAPVDILKIKNPTLAEVGDSLDFVEMIMFIEKELGVQIDDRQLSDEMTVADFAAKVESIMVPAAGAAAALATAR